MLTNPLAIVSFLALFAGMLVGFFQQDRPDPSVVARIQQEAMAKLDFLDGEWRGEAWFMSPSGEKHPIKHTERVGPFLDGTVKVIEGKGYNADGTVGFNALAIISYDIRTKAYTMRSYAQGQAGDFPVKVTPDGFAWDIPAGGATIRYVATVKDGQWKETGERVTSDDQAMQFFEMNLNRIGDTDWPAAGGLMPK